MLKRKKLGIVGGMGSRAGSQFFKKIVDYSPARTDQEFLEIIFHSNADIPDRTRAIVYNETSPIKELLRSVHLFNQNQVEVIALSCITSYYYYNEICLHTDARVIHPIRVMRQYIDEQFPGATRVGILATTGTIHSKLFHRELKGLEVVSLPPADQESVFMRSVYMENGFKSAHICQHARDLMYEAFQKLSEQGVDVIIGGCTEVSLGIDPKVVSFPYIDALDLLARKTVEYCYSVQPIHLQEVQIQ